MASQRFEWFGQRVVSPSSARKPGPTLIRVCGVFFGNCHTIAEEERIVLSTRRMILGEVQRGEIVEIVLDFRARAYAESGVAEDAVDPGHRTGDRMAATDRGTTPRQSDIHCVAGELGLQGCCIERLATIIDLRLQRLLGLVDLLTGLGTFVCGQFTQGFQTRSQLTLLAKVSHPDRIQCGQVSGSVNLGRCRRD